MLIYEIVKRKQFIEHKLKDIDTYINNIKTLNIVDKAATYNKAIEIKFTLLSKLRSHIALLREQNKLNTVLIGKDELTIEEVLYLRDTIITKIKTLDKLIFEGDMEVINIFSLMEQRDGLFEEYMLLELAVKESDMTSSWES